MKPRRLIEFEGSDAEKVEQLELLAHDATTALFEIKRLLTKGGTLLNFFDDVEKLVTTEQVRAALHWRRTNTKRLQKKKKVAATEAARDPAVVAQASEQPKPVQKYYKATREDLDRYPVLFSDGTTDMCEIHSLVGTRLKGIQTPTGIFVQLDNLWKGEGENYISILQGRHSTVPAGVILDGDEEPEIPKPRVRSGMRAWCKLNIGCEWQPKTAGFWRETMEKPKSASHPLPWPVKLKLNTYNKEAFLKQLAIEERKATRRQMKGWSTNRWTGEKNGSAEFQRKGWRWPSGYRTYLEAGLLPSASFFKFIMGYDLPGLQAF